MLSEEATERLANIFVQRIEQLNTMILTQIGNNIDEINKVGASDAQRLAQMLKYGGSYDKIIKYLSKVTKKNVKDIDKIFKEVAKRDLNFAKDFYKYKNIDFIPYEQNLALKNQVEAISRITKSAFINISRSNAIGYSIKDDKDNIVFKGLKEVYEEAIDKAVLSVSRGEKTFDDELHQLIKNIGVSGLKTVDYQSGRSIRLDSATNMYIQGALRELHNETQKEIGKQFGSDGVEISVHEYPAPDHEEVQGRQFKDNEWIKLQKGLTALDINNNEYCLDHDHKNGYRPISTMNCYHYVFAILVGVSRPNYSDKELQEIRDRNNKGVEIDGKHYTMYEATQLQRGLERKIREQKDLQIIAKASNDTEEIYESQRNITTLTKKYKELSEKSGLSVKADRLRVSGYKRMAIKNIEKMKDDKLLTSMQDTTPPLSKYQELLNGYKGTALGDETYKNMLQDFNKWYNTLDKKEVQRVLEDLQEHERRTNSMDIKTMFVKESNPLGEFINKKFSYDKLPKLIDKEEYWIDEDGQTTDDYHFLDENHWFRGVFGDDSQKYIKEFKTGKFYAGEGYEGNGTWVTNSYSQAENYSGFEEKNIIYIVPKENAKIIPYEKIMGLGSQINNQIDFNKYMNKDGELYINFIDRILNDNGYLASILGYDIIDFKKYDNRKLILNRSSIKVVR